MPYARLFIVSPGIYMNLPMMNKSKREDTDVIHERIKLFVNVRLSVLLVQNLLTNPRKRDRIITGQCPPDGAVYFSRQSDINAG